MVRAGVIDHPKEWKNSGNNEIQNLINRCNLKVIKMLHVLFRLNYFKEIYKQYKIWIDDALKNDRMVSAINNRRVFRFEENFFMEVIHKKRGYKVKGRKVSGAEKSYLIREPAVSYSILLGAKTRFCGVFMGF